MEGSRTDLLECVRARLLAAFPRARRLILFGSRARGDAAPDSDVDLLLVAVTDLPAAERGQRARLALRGLPVGFDILVVTPEEFERLRGWRSTVVSRAVREGKVLHEAA
jgi:predicted nucleotidyltransferase